MAATKPMAENRAVARPAPAAPLIRPPPPKPMPVPVVAPSPMVHDVLVALPTEVMVEQPPAVVVVPAEVARIETPKAPQRAPAVDDTQAGTRMVLAETPDLDEPVVVSQSAESTLEFLPEAPAKEEKPRERPKLAMCGICQSAIGADEPMKLCAECGLTYHADCWAENRGCASYGCSQVGALEPPGTTAVKDVDVAELIEPFPWEFLLLGASVVALVAGALAFGLPSGLLGVFTLWVGVRRRLKRWPMLAACGALCLVGLVVGLEFSKFWWLGFKPFEWIAR